MSAHIKGFAVTMDRDVHPDEAEAIKNALLQIKGVVSVDPIISEAGDIITEMRVKAVIKSELYELIDKVDKL
jgi:hypothetical protein